MCQGKFKFLAGNSMINPDLAFRVEQVPLFISTVKEFFVNILADFVSVDYPYRETLFITIVAAVYTLYSLAVFAGYQHKQATNAQ